MTTKNRISVMDLPVENLEDLEKIAYKLEDCFEFLDDIKETKGIAEILNNNLNTLWKIINEAWKNREDLY